jgi:signal transduction histidine kinase/ligand-binding sensor domain-containing protein
VPGSIKYLVSLIKKVGLVVSVILLSLHITSYSIENSMDSPSLIQPTIFHQWGAITLFHGLPSDRVRSIVQDTEGIIWFGTDSGLVKYDGRRTQAIIDEGLPIGSVLALKLDLNGAIWIGTDKGAARFISGKFTAIEETVDKPITAIITPQPGRAILASEGMIFDCQDRYEEGLKVDIFSSDPKFKIDMSSGVSQPLYISSLALMDGTILAGTRGRGLITIKGKEIKEITSRPRAYFVEAIEKDDKGRIWIGTQSRADTGGLYQFTDPLRPIRIAGGIGAVTALHVDKQGNVWVGTDQQGAFLYTNDIKQEQFTFEGTAGGLRSNHIYSIFEDREGVIWFGTDRGVCRYDRHAPRTEILATTPNSNFIRALYKSSDNRLWCGTNSGLFTHNGSNWEFVEQMAEKAIYAIAEDHKGRLLVGTTTGLYLKNSSDSSWKPVENDVEKENQSKDDSSKSIRAITKFKDQTFIATFGRGLEKLEESNDLQCSLIWPTGIFDEKEREVICLHVDSKGLWLGTTNRGAFIYDGKEVQSAPKQSFEQLKDTAIRAIAGTLDNWLWFGTSRGAYIYKAGNLVAHIANHDVRGLIVTNNSPSVSEAWCATAGSGLLKISIDEKFGALVSQIDVEQGLSSQNAFSISSSLDKTGNEVLLIGTNRGLTHYIPGKVAPVLKATRILSRHLHELDEGKTGIHLEYPQNSLALDVNATSSRTFPEQFQYGFLLYTNEGKIIKQKISHDPQFLMENLRPGRYRVWARAFSKDLIPSEPLQFEFVVPQSPFPWTTAALSALLACSLIALWWGAWQNKRMARTSADLELANRQLADARLQLANEAETERRRIARDLHDQTLADLRGLLLLTDQLPTDGSVNSTNVDPIMIRSEIESISKEIRRICEDLSPSVLENVGLTAALEWAIIEAVKHLPNDRKFEYEFTSDEDIEDRLQLSPAVRIQIYRIIQEVISNICRHASPRHVKANTVLTKEGELVITIEDDGQSFDFKDKKIRTGRGLTNIRARASLIEAKIEWTTRTDGGTIFTLRKTNAGLINEKEVSDHTN